MWSEVASFMAGGALVGLFMGMTKISGSHSKRERHEEDIRRYGNPERRAYRSDDPWDYR